MKKLFKIITIEPIIGIALGLIIGKDTYYNNESLNYDTYMMMLIVLPFLVINIKLFKM